MILKRRLLLPLTCFFFTGVYAQPDEHVPGNHIRDTVSFHPKPNTSLSNIEMRDRPTSDVEVNFSGVQISGLISVTSALQGRVSGLDVISASGDPGTRPQALIHGLSLSGNYRPLVVIDGIPLNQTDDLFNYFNKYNPDLRSLIPVALQDIKSVEILKDPSSAVLYGSDGSDGVILIETKTGTPGKIHFNYQFSQSVCSPPSHPVMLDGEQYIMFQLEAWHNRYGVFDVPPEIAYDRDYPGFYNFSANTDWIDAVTQTGSYASHHFNLYGGNAKTRYYVSADYLDQKGTTISTGYKRFIGRVNLEHSFSRKLSLALQASYSDDRYNGNYIPQDRNIIQTAYLQSPNMSIMEYDPEGNLTGDYFTPFSNYLGSGSEYYNPVAMADLANSGKTLASLLSSLNVQYNLTSWFSIRELISYHSTNDHLETKLPQTAIGNYSPGYPDSKYFFRLKADGLRSETKVVLNVPFKDTEKIAIQGSFTWIARDDDYHINITDTKINQIAYIPSLNDRAAVSSLLFKLRDRYILNAGARIESLPDYMNEDSWDKHYGISLGWRFSEEPFLKNLHLPAGSMLHAAWSSSVYQPSDIIASNPLYPAILNNITSYNTGLDLNLIKKRVHIETDIFRKIIKGPQPILDSYFVTGLKNNGWEIMADVSILDMKNWQWTFTANITHNNLTITELSKNSPSRYGGIGNGEYLNYLSENEQPGAIFGFIREGVYPTDEDAIARDKNGDVIYDGGGQPVHESYLGSYIFEGGDVMYNDLNHDATIDENDMVYLGNSYPRYSGGLGSTMQYKNLSLSVIFHYRTGYDIINGVAMSTQSMYTKYNQSTETLNRWRVQGQNDPGMLPRACLNNPVNNLGSDYFVEKGDFLRLNYLNLGYSFNTGVCKKIHVRELTLNLSAQRILTFTGYSGLDPEIERSSSSGLYWLSREDIRSVPPKVYTVSIEIGL